MDGISTPRRRGRVRLHRAALVGAVVFACACNFAVAGFDAHDTADAGSPMPVDMTSSGMTPAPDLALPADLATTHDLSTPMPDLSPLPDNVGDECAGSCGAGLTCMNWVPNGYCSASCDGSSNSCPAGSSCVDISGGNGGAGMRYCLVNANGGGNCMRQDLQCRDCNVKVCGPSSFCGGC